MTRVLHVLDHSLPLHSGYTFRTRAILKSQQAAGIEVRGITGLRHMADGPDAEEAGGILFHRTRGEATGPAGLREWREIGLLASAIETLCQEWRPDVIHAHSPALCGAAALRAARRLGIPIVYEIRAFWEDAAVGNGTGSEGSLKYRLTRSLENHVVKGADAVVTICQGLKDDLVARGTDPGRITISPNGVDLSLFGEPLAPDPVLRTMLSIGNGPVIGFIGSFYDYEGLDVLIEAMPLLLERQPDARLLMVGGGPCEAALREQALNSPAADAIRFVGRVPHHEVDRYYALCDIMAYPRKASRLTDLVTPLKPLEAMAQDKLVAASSVGGHRELVDDGNTGILFAPDDPAACADALAGLIERRENWQAIRANGQAHVRQKHDWAKNVDRYLRVYQTLVAIPMLGNTKAA
ncbi:TIGR04063 family PEP-CTERM/XrtA system glycosyltransferase [Novosphingobium sp. TH158]|uniref:TIGR04063 family PEP-CTERM/XrtA system glycosyltransferase n=1 Tax=Novosphingobium sp. TH158 TaxID=2067455 RepID=UPI000C7A39CB|nr:TIGR04063 family PEP-CTERM/XrtA system glycosyltransferase [Novosphingobium sp. TH158]PLK27368.1 glycosyltransferase, exosortase A system-associated [Novosphingobium sp. TH158]